MVAKINDIDYYYRIPVFLSLSRSFVLSRHLEGTLIIHQLLRKQYSFSFWRKCTEFDWLQNFCKYKKKIK